MPRFFFHVNDDLVVDDQEGRELPDADSARQSAVVEARVLMCETLRQGRITLSHRIEVLDEAGKTVAVVPFGDAVIIEQ